MFNSFLDLNLIMWKEADFNTKELVAMAVDCIDKDTDQWRTSGNRFQKIMPLLIEELKSEGVLNPTEYYLSDKGFRIELRDFLNEIKFEDNPADYFMQNIGDLRQEIGTRETKSFIIGFPLNLKLRQQYSQDTYQSLGHKIEQLSRNKWLSEFRDTAIQGGETDQRQGDNQFIQFMQEVPNEFSSRNFTYWKFEITARDKEFAVDRLERVLGYLLGKINVAGHAGLTEGTSTSSSVWQTGWSDLRHPFVYIVLGSARL